MKKCKIKLSKISLMHYVKLVLRSLFFIAALALYISARVRGAEGAFGGYEDIPWLLALIGCVYFVEMALRFFPSHLESPGCQKQFRRSFIPTGERTPRIQSAWRTLAVLGIWLLLNGLIGALYFLGAIDSGILVLVSLAYGVCDMICILFFCPFQTWIMKNRCCTECRIYNWDFAMIFTPFVFIPHPFTYSLLGLSILLLLRWELSAWLHPERFSSVTNAAISCDKCTEKLCRHKRQIMSFIKREK